MRYNHFNYLKSRAMKLSYYISIILLACVAIFISCEQEESLLTEENNESTTKFELVISSADYNYAGMRASNEAYKTTFTNGDAVGIFAIRNGNIVENINNRKFIFDEGIWELEGDVIEYKGTEFQKMKFHAYYPYQEDIVINPDAEDPFENIVQNWKIEADQSGDNYTKFDLMTSVGEAEGQRLQGKVKFIMQHRMALSVIAMPSLVYTFTNLGIDDYSLPVTIGNLSITSNGTTQTVKPYYDVATETYMILVKPDNQFTIKGNYTGSKEMEYTLSGTLAEGAAKKYTIKDENKITHTLAVGDYFCANGTIVSKDVTEVPDNCIGIIFYTGNPQPSYTHPDNYTKTSDALLRDFPGMNHGLVIALNNGVLEDGTEKNKFADGQSYFSNWYKTDEEWSDKFINNESREVIPGFLGYNSTKLMEISYNSGASSGCTYGWLYVELYRSKVPVSAPTTDWYLPSAYDLDEVAKSQHVINAQLKAASGQELESNDGLPESGTFYWTCNERNNSYMWVHKMAGGTDIALRERLSRSGYFRMILAF
jgi:hypothetical protein